MTDDIDRIMAVMGSAFDPEFGEAWTRRQVEDALLMGHCYYLLDCPQVTEQVNPAAFDNRTETAGFALSRYTAGEEELLLFAVAPEWRRQGVGARLLAGFASAAQARGAERLLLEMRDGNPAESLYRKHGFVPIGRRPNYYRTVSGTRLDAVTFARDLMN